MKTEKRKPILGDPELDRIFTEAYADTMEQAYRLEREKQFSDHVDAFAELFERELSGRDLTPTERTQLTEVFRDRIEASRRERESRIEAKRRKRNRGIVAAASTLVAAGAIFLLAYKPLTPISTVEQNLDLYIERVDAGYGDYANRFYRLIDRYDHRIDDGTENQYRTKMYDALDVHFRDLLTSLQSGDLTLWDDAKDWAKLFPDRADRKARKELVDNARVKAVGGALGNILERAGEIINKTANDAADWAERTFGDGNASDSTSTGAGTTD